MSQTPATAEQRGSPALPQRDAYAAALQPPGNGHPCWRADVPDLPGCHCSGETLAELLAVLVDAVEGWVARAQASGAPVPPPSSLDGWARSPDFPGCLWSLVRRPPPLDSLGIDELLAGDERESAAAPPLPAVPLDPAPLQARGLGAQPGG